MNGTKSTRSSLCREGRPTGHYLLNLISSLSFLSSHAPGEIASPVELLRHHARYEHQGFVRGLPAQSIMDPGADDRSPRELRLGVLPSSMA